MPYNPLLFLTVIGELLLLSFTALTWLTVLTRFDPLTYIVSPMRHAVFSHLTAAPAAASFLAPNVTWAGWQVPVALSLGMVAVMGAALLGIEIAEFQKTE